MTGRRRTPGGRAAAARHRHAWLEVVTTSGPFLTLPVADRAFPNGMPKIDTDLRARVRRGVAEVMDDPGTHRAPLIRLVLNDLLGWGDALRMGVDIPDSLAEPVPEHGTVIRPDLSFTVPDHLLESHEEAEDDEENPDSTPEAPERLLGTISSWGAHPLERTASGSWTASPVERLAVLLRARDIPLGLATDGRWWAIVWAPRGGTTGIAVFDASLWSEEPDTLDAFAALLERSRFLGVPHRDRLPALLDESLDNAEAVTEQLSNQVREAVELLVLTLDRLDAESSGALLADVDDDELYAGVVTVMMRIVFLLFAEERRLLRSDADAYQQAYAIAQLAADLEQRADLHGPQTLEHRTAAWHRILAVSRAVHSGVAHEDLRMPAYGGGLFDPDRHAWLEGRRPGANAVGTPPPAVDDRTVLRMLQAVQYVTVGGERRRLTYRALDVEQIGYVYEGLLELEVRTADEPVLQLQRHRTWPRLKGKDEPPELPASVAVEWHATGDTATPGALAVKLKAHTGLSPSRLERLLAERVDDAVRADIAVALDGDEVLIEIAENLAPVLRSDERGHPLITTTGRRYLAKSERRATTGTHYTPRSLAEEVVEGALEPLCYRPGPLETDDRNTWQIRPSTELLALRVADIAMGSGAFLVAACRYLADRLLEAWNAEGRREAAQAIQGREGPAVSDVEVERVMLDARRLVAEHSLYGVDINPLAVEMAKLSLWLITMDDERPFGFLDDRLICGDSLLGLATWPQLRELHPDATVARRRAAAGLLDFTGGWRDELGRAADLRRRITAAPVTTIRDVEHKQRLLVQAREVTNRLGTFADAATAVGLQVAATASERTRDSAFEDLRIQVGNSLGDAAAEAALAKHADETIQDGRPPGTDRRRPLHWPLAFPEILVDDADPGFDGLVGNPAFLGGQKLRGALGDDYAKWLQRWDGRGVRGSADLAARFVLRAMRLLNSRGQLGFITTNTLLEGATLEVGMLQAVERGLTIRAGRSSHPWPSRSANLEIINVWASRTPLAGDVSPVLDGEPLPRIGPDLQPVGRIEGRPVVLTENDGVCFQGSNVLGTGFTMPPEDADALIRRHPRNAEALQPYVIGQDLNQRPDTSASRWVINFRDWPLERAEQYPDLIEIVRRRVKPERDRNNDRRRREIWWQFTRPALDLYDAVDELDHVLAISLVGNAIMPVRVPTGAVFAHACGVFSLDEFASLAVLSSSAHQSWVIRYTSTMRTDIRYAPSDVFDTLPRPNHTPDLEALGERLDIERRRLMLERSWGLTTTYNHVHDPGDTDPAVKELRDLHADIDHAVMDAYGWDLDLGIGHHRTKIGTRWTVNPAARFELLDLLLEENHRRAGILSR